MSTAAIGELVGAFLALGGFAYIWLGLLWATRVYKRWPRHSYWSAIGLALMVGSATARASDQSLLYAIATIAVCAVLLFRARHILFPARAGQTT